MDWECAQPVSEHFVRGGNLCFSFVDLSISTLRVAAQAFFFDRSDRIHFYGIMF